MLVRRRFMNDLNDRTLLLDNGGRRRGDRRQFSYSCHVPERRNGLDRRSGMDRRKSPRDKQ